MNDKKWPKTEDELIEYIREELNKTHDYSSAADVPVNVGVAAFNYVATTLGLTGFQGSWATLKLFGELRNIKGSFAIIEGRDFLFPQYDPVKKVESLKIEWKDELKKEARKKLNESPNAHPDVIEHWKKIIKDKN